MYVRRPGRLIKLSSEAAQNAVDHGSGGPKAPTSSFFRRCFDAVSRQNADKSDRYRTNRYCQYSSRLLMTSRRSASLFLSLTVSPGTPVFVHAWNSPLSLTKLSSSQCLSVFLPASAWLPACKPQLDIDRVSGLIWSCGSGRVGSDRVKSV